SMSASDNLPLPRRFLKVALRRSERVSNTVASVLEVGGGTGLPSRVSGPASKSPPPAAAGGRGRGPVPHTPPRAARDGVTPAGPPPVSVPRPPPPRPARAHPAPVSRRRRPPRSPPACS